MKWRWLIGVPLVLVSGSCGALMTIAHVEARDMFERQRAALTEAMTTHAKMFRDDLRVASSLPVFATARAAEREGKDAARFLEERLMSSALPPGLGEKIDAVVIGKFPAGATAIDVSAASLAWTSELGAFDRWELLEERPIGFHTMALPDTTLLTIARARLLHGLAAGDVRSAGRDVEELARLVASTERWPFVVHVATLMQLSRQTYEHARSEGIDVAGWDPPDRKAIDAVRRGLRAYAGALDFHVDPALHGDLLTSPEATAGRCAALNDAAMTYLEMEPVSGDRYRDARDWIARALDATKGTCRLTIAREAWGDPSQRALVVGSEAMCNANDDPATCVAGSIVASFPGMRDMMIEASTVGAAGLFSGYR